jgi:hypothetical protein
VVLLAACLSTSLACASHSSLAVQSCFPTELRLGMTQDEVRAALGSPAVVGFAGGIYQDPLRLSIGSPADTPGITWLYAAEGQPQNRWLVLTFHGRKVGDIRCTNAWFQMEHDAAEQPVAPDGAFRRRPR